MAKIRGIYATALTKLLLDYNLDIVQPSEEIAERFGLEASEDEPDLSIVNRPDLQGVEVIGSAEAIEVLRSILGEALLDVVMRRRVEGSYLDVEFPWYSKTQLDEYRRAVVPTVKNHHLYKTCGGEISSAMDMAERLLLQGCAPEEVERLLSQTIQPHLPFEGSEIDVEHVKLSGLALNLGKAVIEEYDETSRIIYVREMRSDGIYDGLEVEKEAGDCAVTEAKLGEHYMETRYYSQGGRFKGAYINLNTPVEIYPTKIRYVDLDVDICVSPRGEVKVVDMEQLERAAGELIITDKLFETFKTKVSELQTLALAINWENKQITLGNLRDNR